MKFNTLKQYIMKHGTRTTKDSWLMKDTDPEIKYADAIEIDLSTINGGYRTMDIYVHDDGEVVAIKDRINNDSYRYNFENQCIERHDDFQRLPWDNEIKPWSVIPVDDDGNLDFSFGDDRDIIRNTKKDKEAFCDGYVRMHKKELKEMFRQYREIHKDYIKDQEDNICLCQMHIEESNAALRKLEIAEIRLSIPEFLENPQPGGRFMTRDRQVAIFANKVTQSNGEEHLHWKVERPREGCAEDYGFSTLVNGRFCKKHKEVLDIIKKLDK